MTRRVSLLSHKRIYFLLFTTLFLTLALRLIYTLLRALITHEHGVASSADTLLLSPEAWSGDSWRGQSALESFLLWQVSLILMVNVGWTCMQAMHACMYAGSDESESRHTCRLHIYHILVCIPQYTHM